MKKTLLCPNRFCAALFIFGFFLFSARELIAQEAHPITQVQELYYDGKIDVNEAIVRQIELLQKFEASGDHNYLKCVTPLYAMIEANEDSLSEEALNAIQKLRPVRNKSLPTQTYITPGGKFRITYETDGIHAVPQDDSNINGVPDYIDELAAAADSSYNLQILTLGYSDPIPSGSVYDIFVEDMGVYGFTTTSSASCGGIPASGTCIYVENDFVGFPPNDDPDGDQYGAVRVTVAHEFKHAIQFVESGWQGDPNRWLEMDATLYEEVVYDQVNDYYNYITDFSSDLFSAPSTSLIPGSYEDITWALYFEERFDSFFWPEVWQRIDSNPSLDYLEAVEDEVIDRGESYERSVLESYMWHFATDSRFALPGYGFDESAFYPGPNLSETITDLSTNTRDIIATQVRTSARYYAVDLSTPSTGFVRFDYEMSTSEVLFGLIAYFNNGNYEVAFVEGNGASLSGSYEAVWNWADIDQLGLIVVNSSYESSHTYSFQFGEYSLEDQIEITENFPNPFSRYTNVRISSPTELTVTANLYDILGRHVQTSYDGQVPEGITNLVVDGSSIASGVYFLIIDTPLRTFTRKIMLIK